MRKKFRALIIPFFIYSLVGVVFTLLIQPFATNGWTLHAFLYDIYRGSPNSLYVGQLWFLISLFWINIISYLLFKVKKRWISYTTLMILAGYAILVAPFVRRYLPGEISPLMIDTSLVAVIFFMSGCTGRNIISDFLADSSLKKKLILAAVFTFLSFCSLCNGWVNISIPQFHNVIMYFLFSFIGIIDVILISDLLQRKYHGKFKKYLVDIGSNSMFVFAIHSIPIYIYCYILRIAKIDSEAGVCTVSCGALVGTLLVTVLMLAMVRIKNKVHIKS